MDVDDLFRRDGKAKFARIERITPLHFLTARGKLLIQLGWMRINTRACFCRSLTEPLYLKAEISPDREALQRDIDGRSFTQILWVLFRAYLYRSDKKGELAALAFLALARADVQAVCAASDMRLLLRNNWNRPNK